MSSVLRSFFVNVLESERFASAVDLPIREIELLCSELVRDIFEISHDDSTSVIVSHRAFALGTPISGSDARVVRVDEFVDLRDDVSEFRVAFELFDVHDVTPVVRVVRVALCRIAQNHYIKFSNLNVKKFVNLI